MGNRLTGLFLAMVLAVPAIAVADIAPVGIVAIVDDQVISTVDLNDRIQLIMGLTDIPDTQENRMRLTPQILHQLIDEKLEMEEAGRDNITVNESKIEEGIAHIEKQNGRAPGSLMQFIEAKHLPRASFMAQVRAQIAWSEIVLKKLRPKVRISDAEVARARLRKAESPTKAQEVEIATILLPVDTPEAESNVKKAAEQLAAQIRAGARFEAVAAQFSSGAGGTRASEPFWVETSQIDPAIAAAIGKISKGQITDPVRVPAGYQIIRLMNTREAGSGDAEAAVDTQPRAELAYKEILMALPPNADKKESDLLLKLAQEAAVAPGKCTEKKLAGAGDLADFDFKVSFDRKQTGDLPDNLRTLLMGLKVGAASSAVVTPEGIRIYQLCERVDLPPDPAQQQAIENTTRQSIYEQKLELEAQKYLRDLRREAFIEVRLQ